MIKKTVLPNGMRIISECLPKTFSATVMVWIDAGTNVESLELNGISHFVEHMTFRGTHKRSAKEIVQSVENTGGSINAFTNKENTCYYAKVPSDSIGNTTDILLDIVFNSVYNSRDIELERQVILEEIKMYEDTPDELVHDLLLKSMWGNHPLGQPVTGTEKSVSNISRNNLLNFVSDFYAPDNIVISIAGNFEEDAILSQISNTVGHIKTESKAKKLENPVITPQVGFCCKDIEQSHICLGTRSSSILDEDRYGVAIIDVCLGGGMASRLFQEIREKQGLAYSVSTYESLYRPSGIFGVYAGTNPDNAQKVVDLIMDEIRKFKLDGLSDDELEKAKLQLKGSLFIGLESSKYRAVKNGRSELYFNRVLTTGEVCDSIDKVTHDDIKRLGEYMFDEKYTGIYLVGPKEITSKKFASY